MPLSNGQYIAPTFVNDSAPALNASELNAMAGAVEGAVEYDREQSLSDAQKQTATGNIGAVGTKSQSLTDEEKSQALSNIGGVSYNSQTLSQAQSLQAAKNVNAVSYGADEGLTQAQKSTARSNIDAVSASGVMVSIPSSSWNGNSAPYTASVAVSGVTSSNLIVVGPAASVTSNQYTLFADAQIVCSAQSNNSITLKAFGSKPTAAIPIAVLILT